MDPLYLIYSNGACSAASDALMRWARYSKVSCLWRLLHISPLSHNGWMAPCIFEFAFSGIQTHWISGGQFLEFGVDALSHSATTAELNAFLSVYVFFLLSFTLYLTVRNKYFFISISFKPKIWEDSISPLHGLVVGGLPFREHKKEKDPIQTGSSFQFS